MSLHGLRPHFLSMLNNIPLSGWTTAHLSLYVLQDILMLPSFGNYANSCYKHLYKFMTVTRTATVQRTHRTKGCHRHREGELHASGGSENWCRNFSLN